MHRYLTVREKEEKPIKRRKGVFVAVYIFSIGTVPVLKDWPAKETVGAEERIAHARKTGIAHERGTGTKRVRG